MVRKETGTAPKKDRIGQIKGTEYGANKRWKKIWKRCGIMRSKMKNRTRARGSWDQVQLRGRIKSNDRNVTMHVEI